MNCEAILGSAGTGKSTALRNRIADLADPLNKSVLSASTGIAAVNLGEGVTTVHSVLGYFDQRSLIEQLNRGGLRKKFKNLAIRGKRTLVIDEISMVSGEALDCIHTGATQAAEALDAMPLKPFQPCGLMVVGDACQLPPIADDRTKEVKYFFEADCWDEFKPNVTRLEKVHRQENLQFLEALTLARKGRGADAAIALRKLGVQFAATEDEQFDGITLFPVNKMVADYNEIRLGKLPGEEIRIPSKRWGKERGEWKNIPQSLWLKDGALVMILSNEPGTYRYVNGDLASFHIEGGVTGPDGTFWPRCIVKTKRKSYEGDLPFAVRRNISWNEEDSQEAAFDESEKGKVINAVFKNEGDSKRWVALCMEYADSMCMQVCMPYYDPLQKGTVVGEVEYMPLRAAYGSSYHKTQGLTLDRIQININHYMASQPGMIYVALSRVRGPEGLRIVGDVGSLAKKIKTDSRLREWV